MSPYRRNVMVGLTVLTALGVLGWMILKFGGNIITPFAAPRTPITIVTDRADGLADGSPILFLGQNVGQVVSVTRTKDNKSVMVKGQVDMAPTPLPANVVGIIRPAGYLGAGSNLTLGIIRGQEPSGTLAANQEIPAHFEALTMVPPEFGELAASLKVTVDTFNNQKLIEHIDQQVLKAGEVMDSLKDLVNDPKLRGDINQTMANLREASEAAKSTTKKFDQFGDNLNKLASDTGAAVNQGRETIVKTQQHIDELSKQVGDRLTQVSSLLDQFNSIAAKIDKGPGTASALVNDPRLYDGLVDTTRQLNATILDLKRLVNQWEQEGVTLRLNK